MFQSDTTIEIVNKKKLWGALLFFQGSHVLPRFCYSNPPVSSPLSHMCNRLPQNQKMLRAFSVQEIVKYKWHFCWIIDYYLPPEYLWKKKRHSTKEHHLFSNHGVKSEKPHSFVARARVPCPRSRLAVPLIERTRSLARVRACWP